MEADRRVQLPPELHRRLLADAVAVGASFPLVLTGGYALRAHGLVERPVRGPALATGSPAPMREIAAVLRGGLLERGWRVRDLEAEPLSARFTAGDPVTDAECQVHVLKETMWRPPVPTAWGLALAVEDVIGTKVRALAERGFARDLVDVHAASARWSRPELEEFGRRHARDALDLADLRDRLDRADWYGDAEFAGYGLDAEESAALRRWAQEWSDDIGERLVEEAPYEDDDTAEAPEG
ncbi:nucleotidyl transferase AbiEii/AbiGii toxin family protein [Streptoverticillium reticulum]|uniref:nucleotidyl transferase AbiEii/AbiGii toxin family protein n=1 Tax=Streptoverticillium reticulum TaxID=1433415 RepID=UPI0039BF31E5